MQAVPTRTRLQANTCDHLHGRQEEPRGRIRWRVDSPSHLADGKPTQDGNLPALSAVSPSPKAIRAHGVGTIRRLAVRDFMTYDDVEIYPGPSMNLILGGSMVGLRRVCGAPKDPPARNVAAAPGVAIAVRAPAVGVNGTGKSALVAAICLGLGGTPAIVGIHIY